MTLKGIHPDPPVRVVAATELERQGGSEFRKSLMTPQGQPKMSAPPGTDQDTAKASETTKSKAVVSDQPRREEDKGEFYQDSQPRWE